jgi:lactoylglutathione lyase
MKLGYVIVYVPDVAKATAFYQKAFGLKLRFAHESGQYAEMETGETALGFAHEALAESNGVAFRRCRPGELAPGVEIALTTTNVENAFERAVAEGAREVAAPAEKPWGQTVSYVRDLNGVLVEICSPISS